MNALEQHFKKHRTGAAALATTPAQKKESEEKFSFKSWLARNRGGAMALVKKDAQQV